MYRVRNCFLLLFFFGCSKALFAQSADTIFLNTNWMFSENGQNAYFTAQVPGTVHADLFNNNLISDPFYDCNEKDLQWIESKSWVYSTTFRIDENLLSYQHIELIAEGLDTYAKVFINDKLVINANNMFRLWDAECKQYLQTGLNKITVVFESVVEKGKESASQLKYTLPSDERVFVRKAQYQFGWDWGGRFVGCGIWKPIYLKAWTDIDLIDVKFIQQSLDKNEAKINITSLINSAKTQEVIVKITDASSGKDYAIKNLKLINGANTVSVDFTIENPILWWTHDIGKPNLYHFNVSVFHKDKCLAKHDLKVGLRTIEVINDKDQFGESFYFKLNGKPIFIKGANYIPQDNFLNKVTPKTYNDLLDIAVNSNMNMLRVWGGGIYENDIFYNLCDEKGILIWQDFMFACAMYPGDSAFMKNTEEEIICQVKRLRNHPSIALWCGNNEIDEGWHNWGWQKQFNYSNADSTEIWNNYLALFHKLIPNVLKVQDESRFYWPSSPKYGWGREKSYSNGDSHYWGVWWGMEPFGIYKKKVGRFASEYGFQAFPEKSILLKVMEEKELFLESEALKCHEKHPRGFETIKTYMLREYNLPKNIDDYIYVSQLLQAYGIKTAIEAHRNAKPRCMGTLYWQFNDCWPVISWSGLDYYHNPKALQYFVKKAYNNLLLTFENNDSSIDVIVNSDKLESTKASLELKLVDFKGNVIWQEKKEVIIKENSCEITTKINTKALLADSSGFSSVVLYGCIKVDEELVSDNFLYFNKNKGLKLTEPEITYQIESLSGKFVLTIQNRNLAKNVFIRFDGCEGKENHLFDNFFDLLPSSKRQIIITSDRDLEFLKSHIRISSLVDCK